MNINIHVYDNKTADRLNRDICATDVMLTQLATVKSQP